MMKIYVGTGTLIPVFPFGRGGTVGRVPLPPQPLPIKEGQKNRSHFLYRPRMIDALKQG